MPAWTVAPCLDILLAQINKYAPNRSKLSDGSIGDAAHAARLSDHNPVKFPFCATPLVTARDFTHDPDGGFNAGWLAGRLVNLNDPRIKYIIWNRQIWEKGTGWKPYTGPNPHTKHVHVSVKGDPEIMLDHQWMVPEFGGGPIPAVPPTPVGKRNLQRGDTGPDVLALVTFFNKMFPGYSNVPIPITKPPQPYGPQTEGAVKEFQRRSNLAPDGIVGPQTYAALARLGFR